MGGVSRILKWLSSMIYVINGTGGGLWRKGRDSIHVADRMDLAYRGAD